MYKKIIVPLFYWFDPEKVQITLRSILHGIESQKVLLFFSTLFLPRKIDDKRLHVKVAGIVFANPILVAAGFDKYAEVIRMLSVFGFSGVEVGSVVVYPQPGNPKPRLFIHSSGVILNHFGFNSPGMEVVAKNLEKYKHIEVPIGINIGKNKYVPNPSAPELYTIAIRRFYEYASYFVINISSPNTKNLRDLHEKKALEEIIKQVLLVMKQIGGIRPLFIKIAPDISQKFLDEVIRVVIKNKLTGIIASNTTTNMHLKAKYTQDWEERPGGLSGDDNHFRTISTKQIAYIFRKAKGKITIIGVGGIKNGATAIEKIRAGASLIQVMSALYTEGPMVASKINKEILQYLQDNHIKRIVDIVGKDSNKW